MDGFASSLVWSSTVLSNRNFCLILFAISRCVAPVRAAKYHPLSPDNLFRGRRPRPPPSTCWTVDEVCLLSQSAPQAVLRARGWHVSRSGVWGASAYLSRHLPWAFRRAFIAQAECPRPSTRSVAVRVRTLSLSRHHANFESTGGEHFSRPPKCTIFDVSAITNFERTWIADISHSLTYSKM